MNKQGIIIQSRRLKFRKGLQKQLINNLKNKIGFNWPKLAKLLDVSEGTLKAWFREEATLPESILDKIMKFFPESTKEKIINEFVEEILSPNWGRAIGGRNSIDKIRKVNFVKDVKNSKEFAEFVGIMLGDGHLSKKGIEIILESPSEFGFGAKCSLLIKQLFGIDPIIRISKKTNSFKIIGNSKSLVSLLVSKGLFVGDKIKNNVGIPSFIFNDNDLLTSCIRGLIDTDGGIFSKDKKGSRAIIEFENESTKLREDFKRGLKKLGFTPSISGKTSNSIRIQRQEEVKKFIKEIGFNNKKNVLKSQQFLKKGLIPSTKEIKLSILKEAPMIQPG